MNRFGFKTITIIASILLLAICSVSAKAQSSARIDLTGIDKLKEKASEVVDVSLDEKTLPTAAKFLKGDNPDEAKIRELVSKLKEVYVRVFEFDKPGAYNDGDIKPIRDQLKSSGWTTLVSTQSKRDGENAEIHVKYHEEAVMGLAIIVAEPKELVLVNIIGPIDIEKLSQLGGLMSIPKLNLPQTAKPKLNRKDQQ